MFEISLRLECHQYLATEILLDELGAVSISIVDAEDSPIFVEEIDTTPLWQQITLTALFVEDIELQTLQDPIEDALAAPVELSKRVIQDQDWQKKWIQNLKPMQFSERLWVCPSWITYPDPFAINIQLDPGLAFGTGTHPTTALCMQRLANYSLADKTVMDFGCGSGILAIAAYYLGAKKIIAIDHDPQAIQATGLNANINGVDSGMLQMILADSPPQQSCDVIIANVLLLPLLKYSADFAKAMSPSSKIILSGILEEQLEQIKHVYEPTFKFDNIHSKKEWLLIEASLNQYTS
ncbi:MAG: 50S ribosomal protein L11 methyltransferase [Gammaproteobacteria bacterium]|nr:50S ribosomal protein L11 methyltransferase [Gammaproteobacteria bacterium]